MSRIIAIGDIHGCHEALERLLESIEPSSDDILIGLGDYVDRGPNPAAVIEILINLVSRCRFIPLIGNHEIMFFKALQGGKRDFEFWYQHGGFTTLASYGGNLKRVPQHHFAFLSHCLRYYETDSHFFVHASFEENLPLADQPDDVLFWQHIGDYPPQQHESGKIAIVGHTPQFDGEILSFDHLKVLDTFCYGGQWLSAMEVTTGKIWQANNAGELREDHLTTV
jgi:serine/threonine protein phosphatase 1